MSDGLPQGLSARAALQVAIACVATWGCGQVAREQNAPAGSSGNAGTGQVTAAEDPVWCDAHGNQVTRRASGAAEPTGIICTVKVVVDDETSVPCTTKADGTYRCWSLTSPSPLPADDYRQVQQGAEGLTALTRDGRIVSPRGQPSLITAPVIELTSTNMWGSPALCYRTDAAGPFSIWRPVTELQGGAEEALKVFEGPFLQTLCVFEGLAYGLRPDGSIFDIHAAAATGSGFTQIAASVRLVCGVRADGSISCSNGWAPLLGPCPNGIPNEYCQEPRPALGPPIFPADQYLQVATSYEMACAVTASRALVCLRADGQALSSIPGRYVSVAAGGKVMCAIRVDGTTQCWKRGGDDIVNVEQSTELAPYSPAPVDAW